MICECVPLSEWIKGTSGVECRSCALAVGVASYQELLESVGMEAETKELSAALEDSEEPLYRTAEVMDRIKQAVGVNVREELCAIDAEIIQQSKEVHDGG